MVGAVGGKGRRLVQWNSTGEWIANAGGGGESLRLGNRLAAHLALPAGLGLLLDLLLVFF